jgi:hypothetical protein
LFNRQSNTSVPKGLVPVVLDGNMRITWEQLYSLATEAGVDPIRESFMVPTSSPSGLTVPNPTDIATLGLLNGAIVVETPNGHQVQLVGEEQSSQAGGVQAPNVEVSTGAAAKRTRFA